MSTPHYDLAVIGAGILGLAHAWLAAARHGLRVVVLDGDAAANGASVRNFGFVTVTGQAAGDCWEKALRSRELWLEAAAGAGIAVQHRGLLVAARRAEAEAVIDAFLATAMGEATGCRKLDAGAARARCPALRPSLRCALESPHELRVESREALPALVRWLQQAHGVAFRWRHRALALAPPRVHTSRGDVHADAVIACTGDDLEGLFAAELAEHGIERCKLHMLRLAPATPVPLGAGIMSDLGLARYHGYAALPEAGRLAERLREEQAEALDHGVHLIAVQSADGSVVAGDSHHYAATPDPFLNERVCRIILDELDAVLDLGTFAIEERWLGTYAYARDRWRLTLAPQDNVRLVLVTGGTGASTAFAIAEETLAGLYGSTR